MMDLLISEGLSQGKQPFQGLQDQGRGAGDIHPLKTFPTRPEFPAIDKSQPRLADQKLFQLIRRNVPLPEIQPHQISGFQRTGRDLRNTGAQEFLNQPRIG